MTTKFILHGGYASKINSENDSFFREIVKDTPNQLNILLIYFAREISEHKRIFDKDTNQFKRNADNRNINFEIATTDNFLNQLEQTDIVYLRGGKTLQLLKTLKTFPEFVPLCEGKVIAGESAGTYVLSSYFYSKTEGGVFKRLGLVPVKAICHYIGENREKLDKCPKNLELLLLKDYEFKVFKYN